MKEYILHQGRAVVKVPLSKIYYVTTHPTKAQPTDTCVRHGTQRRRAGGRPLYSARGGW